LGNTTTKTGLRIQTALDSQIYPTVLEVPDEVMNGLNLEKSEFHGDWNMGRKRNASWVLRDS
jgi:hypothetical protein